MRSTALRTVVRRTQRSEHAPQERQSPRRPAAQPGGGPTPQRPARLFLEALVAIAVTGVLAFFEVGFVLTSTGAIELQHG